MRFGRSGRFIWTCISKYKQYSLIVLLGLACWTFLSASIVINEVCYDPTGSDSGLEWIELYNNGDTNVNLDGAEIHVAGSSFTRIFTIPYFILRPGRYLLMGGNLVPNAIFTFAGTLQNGGSETDAIRYVSPNGNYTDTVHYDSPNTYQLVDDTGIPAESFAPDVPEGYSLGRKINGLDTNNSAVDFIPFSDPSPGLPNPVACDYAIGSVELDPDLTSPILSVWICNRSHYSPLHQATLDIYVDQVLMQSLEIAPIPAGDSTMVQAYLSLDPVQSQSISLILSLPGDPDQTNNTWSSTTQGAQAEASLSELMYYPDAGKPEWIEIVQKAAVTARASFVIRDASGNSSNFSLPPMVGYYVICADSASFAMAHPDCPPEVIVKTNGWANLNNDGDVIYLYNISGQTTTLTDSLSYNASSTRQGYSLERVADEDDYRWQESRSPGKSSPGAANSASQGEIPQIEGRLAVIGSPFQRGEQLQIVYQLPAQTNRISCSVYDQDGRRRAVLAANQELGSSGQLLWDGKSSTGSYLPAGLYFIVWESRPAGGGRTYRKQMTAVFSN